MNMVNCNRGLGKTGGVDRKGTLLERLADAFCDRSKELVAIIPSPLPSSGPGGPGGLLPPGSL
jgi:hypothetical protein